MEGIDYWRFCDEVSVIQAALLILGLDPGVHGDMVHRWNAQDQPMGYAAVLNALKRSVASLNLKAELINLRLEPGDQRLGDQFQKQIGMQREFMSSA